MRRYIGLVAAALVLLVRNIQPALAQVSPSDTIPGRGSARSCDGPNCYVGVGSAGSSDSSGGSSGGDGISVVPVDTGGGSSTGGRSSGGGSGGSSAGSTNPGPPQPVLCETPAEFANPGPGTTCGTNNPYLIPPGELAPPAAPAAGGAAPPPPPPTGAQVAQKALNSFTVPRPVVVMAPPGPSFVNFKTWLAVQNWAPVTATATLAGISSTITGVPQKVTWEMGPSDSTVVCDGPGRRYDHSIPDEWQDTDCGYTYRRSSAGIGDANAYSARAVVTYGVTWTSTDGTSGVVGPVSRSTTFSVRVAEIQAINTRPT